jgi:ammonium transporter, Amt family
MATNTTEMPSVTLSLDSGDNAWMMTSTAFVLLMTPALAFFYGGLVDRKNILNQLFLSFICMGIVFVQWVLVGFSFAFGPPVSRGFGSFGDALLSFGQRLDEIYSPTYPLLTYAAYQGSFAIITPALISGENGDEPRDDRLCSVSSVCRVVWRCQERSLAE